MSTIFTIGYGNRSIEDFLKLIQLYRLEYVIDVRSQPFSRINPNFSQKALEEHLKKNNIRYVFMGDNLGGRPSDPDCYTAEGKVDYQKCKTKQFYLDGLERIKNASLQNLGIVLMCSELKPQDCHRTKLIGESLVEHHIQVVHIDESGGLKPHELVMSGLLAGLQNASSGQLRLFDIAPALTSRKSYRKTGPSKKEVHDETED